LINETGDVAAPYGTDKKNFLADFSNISPEIDVTGPGVGILSTVPGGYAPMDGTSMACPAVTGAAARLLAGNPAVLDMNRDPARSDKIAALLYQSAKALGLGLKSEGHGLPG
jgi:subtilisin family serine protease